MAHQIASLERKVAADEAEIGSLHAELVAVNKPPAGYTKAFITKVNWDHLDGEDGIIYYARSR